MALITNSDNLDVDDIFQLGWRQGSVFPYALAKRIKSFRVTKTPLNLISSDIVIIISHDCDVTHYSFENEPYVEVLYASAIPADDINGNLTYGKNPRKYQFATNSGLHYEVSINSRLILKREILLLNRPDKNRFLDFYTLVTLRRWLINRYLRAAFPDSFNSRLKPQQSKIRALLKRSGHDLSGIYLICDDDEKSEDSDYIIFITGTVPPHLFQIADSRAKLQGVIGDLASLIDSCTGLTVHDFELVSESDFSLSDIDLSKRLDYDDLSERQAPHDHSTPIL